MKASLIIAFYNNTRYLALIFEALKRQTERDFEVIIADDGSNPDSVKIVDRLISEAPFPVNHVWHEDKGWRKNIILNKSVVAAKSDYIIFLDGDCIPHHKFIAEHTSMSTHGTVVAGRRVQLTHVLSEAVTPRIISSGRLHSYVMPRMLWAGIKGEERHVDEGLRMTNKTMRRLFMNKRRRGILGCNFSMYKEDLMKVNGFDERFLLPGTGEDTDLEERLNRVGIFCRVESHHITVYHRKHKREDLINENVALYEENNRNNVSWTPYGIVKEY